MKEGVTIVKRRDISNQSVGNQRLISQLGYFLRTGEWKYQKLRLQKWLQPLKKVLSTSSWLTAGQ